MNELTVFSNLSWSYAEKICAELIAFIISIVLARILEPSDYGTISIIMVFVTVLRMFIDNGFGNALIQKRNPDNLDFSSVFYTNTVICIALYSLLFLVAPFIADFYNDSNITAYMRALGLTVLFAGFSNIQTAYASSNMMFKKFFFSNLGGNLLGGIAGLILALKGFGAWALVWQNVVNIIANALILWIIVRWQPSFEFSFVRLKTLFNYGWKITVSSLIDVLYENIYALFIGKCYSTIDLSFYNRGDSIPGVIIDNLDAPISTVLFPAMSKEQEDTAKLKMMTKKSIKVSFYVIAPIMMGLIICAKPIVGLLLTDKWLPCTFYLQAFCVMYMFYPVHTKNLNAIKAVGRSDIFLKVELLKKVVGIVILLATLSISVKAVAIGVVISSLICLVINATPNKKLMGYGFVEQIKDIAPIIILVIVMGIVIYPIKLLNLSYVLTLLIQILLGACIYILGSKLLRIDSFVYICDVIRTYVKKAK